MNHAFMEIIINFGCHGLVAFSWIEDKSPVAVKEGAYHLFEPRIKTNTNATFTWKMCSRSHQGCISIDKSRMFVTASWDLLISPILSSDRTYYPKITLEGGKYFGMQQMDMGTISITGKTSAYRRKPCLHYEKR